MNRTTINTATLNTSATKTTLKTTAMNTTSTNTARLKSLTMKALAMTLIAFAAFQGIADAQTPQKRQSQQSQQTVRSNHTYIGNDDNQRHHSTQDIVVPDGYELVDSIVYRPVALLDSALVGRSVASAMPSKLNGDPANVRIDQSEEIAKALDQQISDNPTRKISGYRVRIFFDNRQNSRTESEAAIRRFTALHPGTAAYRSYVNPYFKVTVGDFRTKSEAMELLNRIQRDFPTAFVVKENINYPVIDINNSYIVDTVHVVRPVSVASSL